MSQLKVDTLTGKTTATTVTGPDLFKTDELQGKTTANDITVTVGASATMSLEQGLAKVWAKWNGVGNSMTDSFNVSSASDTGSGLVRINIDNNMNNATYVITAMGANSDFVQSDTARTTATPDQTSRYDIQNSNYNFTRIDSANMNSAVLGDLA